MKVSAVFENVDAAEHAARQVTESGIQLRRRRVTASAEERTLGSHLPTDVWYFPAAAEFSAGMNVPPHVMMPGMGFYPMAGRVSELIPGGGEARLELEVAEELGGDLCDLLRSLHGTRIHRE